MGNTESSPSSQSEQASSRPSSESHPETESLSTKDSRPLVLQQLSNYEEARELLLQFTPWDDFIHYSPLNDISKDNLPSPRKRIPLYPLDSLVARTSSRDNLSHPLFSSITCNPLYRGTILEQNEESVPKQNTLFNIEDLRAVLVTNIGLKDINQETHSFLNMIIQHISPAEIPQVFPLAQSLRNSTFPAIRAASFALLKLLCRYHCPLSAIHCRWVWYIIWGTGLDMVEEPRFHQLELITHIIESNPRTVSLNGCIIPTLEWIRCAAVKGLLDNHRVLTALHIIGKKILSVELIQDDDAQVMAVISLYCTMVERALQIEESATRAENVIQSAKMERELNDLDHASLSAKISQGDHTPAQNTLCETSSYLSKAPEQSNAEHSIKSGLTVEAAILMLHEIVELIIPLDLLSTTQLAQPFKAICTVLGCRSIKKAATSIIPHTRESEGWDRAAAVALEFIHQLLDNSTYDLASLDIIEELLSNVVSSNIQAAVGALDAYGNYLCGKIDNYFSQISMDEVVNPQNFDDSITFGQLLHFLEEVPQHWIDKSLCEPLLNSLAKLLRRVVDYPNWTESFRISRFVCTLTSHLTVAVSENGLDDKTQPLFNLHTQDDYAECNTLEDNLEVLMRSLISNSQMPTELVPSLLSIASRLNDENLLLVLNKGWSLLSPVYSNWANYLHILGKLYQKIAPGYLQSRREIAYFIEKAYESIADVDIFHGEVNEDITAMFEAVVLVERDDQILKTSFHILGREVATYASLGDKTSYDAATRVCEQWATLACTRCECCPLVASSFEKIHAKEKDGGCSRQLLAVQFLVKAFQDIAFPTSLLLPELLAGAGAGKSSSAGRFALFLFGKLLQMMGLKDNNERISCPKSKLAVLQWLFRLRADSNNHIYFISDDLPEIVPIVTMARRNKNIDNRSFWAHNDVALKRRRHKRGKGAIHERERPNAKAIKVQRPIASQDKKPPTTMLWQLPDPLRIEIPVECTRSSPFMVTREPRHSLHGDYTVLPVAAYILLLCDILTEETNWELVSYVLCHLPVQLFNSNLFCVSTTGVQLQRLAEVICCSVTSDTLYKNMVHTQHIPCSGQVKGLIVQTLAVFIGHNEWLKIPEKDSRIEPTVQQVVVESLIHGLSEGSITRGQCLQALTMALYELPTVIPRYICQIIETLATLATNPSFSVLILEYLFVLGRSRELYISIFRNEDYKRVFGLALMHIQNHARNGSMRNSAGNESYSLAQHINRMSYTTIYVWFLALPVERRTNFVQFILDGLADAASENPSCAIAVEVAKDWLVHYTYGNADNKPHPSFLYKSIIAPGTDMSGVEPRWPEKKRMEEKNTADKVAFKTGNAIVTVSTLRSPQDWARVVITRPAGETAFLCHIEGLRHTNVCAEIWDKNEYDQNYNGRSEVNANPASKEEEPTYLDEGPALISPVLIPAVFGSMHPSLQSRAHVYQNMDGLNTSLEVLHHTPPFNVHRVGVLYVGPGQTQEMEILSNQHGSVTYSNVISRLGRVMRGVQWAHDLMGTRPDTHGNDVISWWDDTTNISFHVATMMPNINDCMYKKQQIGNDAVKIIWNRGGKPFDMNTLSTEFNLFNIIFEPHSRVVYTADCSKYVHKFFKVSIQTPPMSRMPPITPLQGYRIVTLAALPSVLRHSALLACQFCEAWINTGGDDGIQQPLITNRETRLRCIKKTAKYLHKDVGNE